MLLISPSLPYGFAVAALLSRSCTADYGLAVVAPPPCSWWLSHRGFLDADVLATLPLSPLITTRGKPHPVASSLRPRCEPHP